MPCVVRSSTPEIILSTTIYDFGAPLSLSRTLQYDGLIVRNQLGEITAFITTIEPLRHDYNTGPAVLRIEGLTVISSEGLGVRPAPPPSPQAGPPAASLDKTGNGLRSRRQLDSRRKSERVAPLWFGFSIIPLFGKLLIATATLRYTLIAANIIYRINPDSTLCCIQMSRTPSPVGFYWCICTSLYRVLETGDVLKNPPRAELLILIAYRLGLSIY